jgi:hypothetical protein
MDSSKYVLIVAWLFASVTPILMGVFMMLKPKYRNYVTERWFHSMDEEDRAGNRRFVGRLGGLTYVLIGVSFLVIGLGVLYGPQ